MDSIRDQIYSEYLQLYLPLAPSLQISPGEPEQRGSLIGSEWRVKRELTLQLACTVWVGGTNLERGCEG